MRLGEATSLFFAYSRSRGSTADPQIKSEINEKSLLLLTNYYSQDVAIDDITPTNLRDFLARWYLEKASYSSPLDAMLVDPDDSMTSPETVLVPAPLDLVDSIAEFLAWTDHQTGSDQSARLSTVLNELRRSLPCAVAITNALSKSLRKRGGAFSFPEFLTSFEEGGKSQYDIDIPGSVGAIDGYFRIERVEGLLVEAEELISGERMWPIVFSSEVAALLDVGYVISLELLRNADGWKIAGCGFTYPPGTEIGE